jgi:hypothetical protein
MKKMICFLFIGIFSCQKEHNPDERYTPQTAEKNPWVTYEGRVPLSENTNLFIEVSMLASGQQGEGTFVIKEFLETDHVYVPSSSFEGKYSTFYTNNPEEPTVQFHNSALPQPLTRSYLTGHGRMKVIREEPFRASDLAVRMQGNKLVVLDRNQKPVSLDPIYNLTKRSSKLFTVEGYFIHKGDTAEFMEMNTRERWAVSKLGEYYHAARLHHKLAKEKFEVTYLKAVGFSIEHVGKEGETVDALVLKKILQMTSSPSLTDEYKLLQQ